MTAQTEVQSPKRPPAFQIWLGVAHDTGKQSNLTDMIAKTSRRLDASKQAFLQEYWLSNLLSIDRRAHGYKAMYFILRFVAIVGSVVLPFFTITGLTVPAVTLSCLIAACAGWEAFFRYGEKWQLFRRMSVEMEDIGVRYLQTSVSEAVSAEDLAYQRLVEKIQSVIKKKVEGYVDIVEQSLPDYTPTQQQMEEALRAIVANTVTPNGSNRAQPEKTE